MLGAKNREIQILKEEVNTKRREFPLFLFTHLNNKNNNKKDLARTLKAFLYSDSIIKKICENQFQIDLINVSFPFKIKYRRIYDEREISLFFQL